MTTYFCDLGQNSFVDSTGDPDGDGSANYYTGPGGFLQSLTGFGNGTQLAAGDILYIKGTGYIARLVKIVTGSSHATWAAGDTVHDTPSTPDWQGDIIWAESDTTFWVWLDGAYLWNDIDDADGITNDDRGADPTDAVMTSTCYGIEFPTLSGDTTDGWIKFVGVNSSWADDGTYAVLDGEDEADHCLHMESGVTNDMLWFENIRTTRAGTGWYFRGSANSNNIVMHCKSDLCFYGTDFYRAAELTCLNFVCTGSTSDGMSEGIYGYDSIYAFCKSHNNGGVGIGGSSSRLAFYGCLCYENVDNYECDNGLFLNCVADGATSDGIDQQGADVLRTIGCRITNSTAWGVEFATTASMLISAYSYFGGNNGVGDDIDGMYADVVGNTFDGSETDHGYVDSASDDYNLDSDEAAGYAVAIDLDA